MIEIKDEILDGEPRYRVRDNNGNILFDNISIEMKTQILQQGTSLNKELFDKIQLSIDKVGTHSDEQTISQASTIDRGLNTWASSIKAEEKTFVLSEKRFFLIMVDFLSISTDIGKTIQAPKIFFDRVGKNFIFFTEKTVKFSGTDLNETTPNAYMIAKGSNDCGVVLAFLNFNDETNELRLQTALYNTSGSYNPIREQSYTISVGIYEFLANKEGE